MDKISINLFSPIRLISLLLLLHTVERGLFVCYNKFESHRPCVLFREFTILLVFNRFGVGRYQYLPTTPRSQPTNQQSKFDCEAKRKNKALKAKGEALFIISTKLIQKKNLSYRKEKKWGETLVPSSGLLLFWKYSMQD